MQMMPRVKYEICGCHVWDESRSFVSSVNQQVAIAKLDNRDS